MIRGLWVLGSGAALTLVLASRVVFANWFAKKRLSCLCERLPRVWAGWFLRRAGVKVEVEGEERVDWSQPLVIVANHQSWFDVFALAAHLPVLGRFVAKEELARIPVFGPAWQACGHVAIDRSNREQATESLDRAGRHIRDGRLAVILFAEGTRSPDGRLQPFKKGAFVLAIKTGVPVVPVGISGSRQVMPKGSFRIRPGEIRIRIGEPISVEGLRHQDRDRFRVRCRDAVVDLMEDEDAVTGRPGGARPPTRLNAHEQRDGE